MLPTNRNVVLAKPGRHQVVGTKGLYLYVSPDAQIRRWIFRFTSPVTHRITETGLGPCSAVPLADAQEKAVELRRQIARGICPIEAKRTERRAGTTFAEAADAWIETHRPGWRTESQLRNARILLHHHGKALSGVPVKAITPDMIERALADQWAKHPAQARRTLAMWERVMDYAKAKGFREGDNPASWRGCHEYRWPRRQKIEQRHYGALNYAEVPRFMSPAV